METKRRARAEENDREPSSRSKQVFLFIFFVMIFFLGWKSYMENSASSRIYAANATTTDELAEIAPDSRSKKELDRILYDAKMLELANLPKPKIATSTNATSTVSSTTVAVVATSTGPWPAKTVYPNYGALLPFNRIVAYYGNFYSRQMGILGEFDEATVIAKLDGEVKRWEQADPSTPVIPAIHYIAAVAQADKGQDGDYLARMPFSQIDKAITMAEKVNGIVFLDLQIGHSSTLHEVRAIEKYLMLPQVHLGLDPEFSMKNKKKPGTSIGTLDAADINQAIEILSQIVRDNNLPPKVLMIHRFTEAMVTNYQNIKPTPEVQVIMNMDGWGSPQLKTATYRHVIYDEPVQFAGIKLFYKNDLRAPSTRMMTPEEILEFRPKPIYVQYQ